MRVSLGRVFTYFSFASIAGNLLMLYILNYHKTSKLLPREITTNISTGNISAMHSANLQSLEKNMNWKTMNWKDATTTIKTITLQVERPGNFTFPINPVNKCVWNSEDKKTPKFVVVVVSKIDNFAFRYAIRRTWGSFDRKLGTLVFLVGLTEDSDVQTQLRKEVTLYNDVIQVNVTDAYHLLTYKSMAMLEWLYRFCSNADFYLKADDDAYIFMDNVVNATLTFKVKRFFLCHVFKNAKPIRRRSSKWFVPYNQYADKLYPPYCSGPAYVFSSGVLPRLYKSSLTTKFLAMEDIYITGLAAKWSGITYIHSRRFVFSKVPKKIKCLWMKLFSLHKVTAYDILNYHSFYLRNKRKCG